MKVVNETKDEVLAEDAEVRKSLPGKAWGLRLRKKAHPLVFPFRIPRKVRLDMFFVFCTIDVLFLDADTKVVDVKEGLGPWETYRSRERCRYVVELPEGTVSASETDIGDELRLE